jgi:hypothetical protein
VPVFIQPGPPVTPIPETATKKMKDGKNQISVFQTDVLLP